MSVIELGNPLGECRRLGGCAPLPGLIAKVAHLLSYVPHSYHLIGHIVRLTNETETIFGSRLERLRVDIN